MVKLRFTCTGEPLVLLVCEPGNHVRFLFWVNYIRGFVITFYSSPQGFNTNSNEMPVSGLSKVFCFYKAIQERCRRILVHRIKSLNTGQAVPWLQAQGISGTLNVPRLTPEALLKFIQRVYPLVRERMRREDVQQFGSSAFALPFHRIRNFLFGINMTPFFLTLPD